MAGKNQRKDGGKTEDPKERAGARVPKPSAPDRPKRATAETRRGRPLSFFVFHSAALLLVLFGIALGVRLDFAPFTALEPEEFKVLSLAREFRSGDGGGGERQEERTGERPLARLYPALVAAGVWVGADPERWGSWLSILLSALGVVPLYLVATRLGSKLAGVVAGLLYAFLPFELSSAALIAPWSAFNLFFGGALWFLLELLRRPRLWTAGACGLAAALCADTLAAGLMFFALLPAALALIFAARKVSVKAGARLAVVAAVCFLVAGPPGLKAWRHLGGVGVSGEGGPGLAAVIAGDENGSSPGQGPGAAAKVARRFFLYPREAALAVVWPFWLMAAVGAVLVPGRRRETIAAELLFWSFIWGLGLALAVFTPDLIDRRLALPMATLACVLAGRGVAALPGWARSLAPARLGKAAWALLAGLQLAGVIYLCDQGAARAELLRKVYAEDDRKDFEVAGHREAMDQARSELSVKPRSRICAPLFSFAYYLDGEWVEAAETPAAAAEQLVSGACDYLVVDDVSVAHYRRGLRELIAGTAPLPGAVLVFRRYLADYSKLVSVYRAGSRPITVELESPTLQDLEKLLVLGAGYRQEGKIEEARQVFEAILEPAPQNMLAHRELLKIYLVYGASSSADLARAEDHLLRYSFIAPDDANLKSYQSAIREIGARHDFQWGARR